MAFSVIFRAGFDTSAAKAGAVKLEKGMKKVTSDIGKQFTGLGAKIAGVFAVASIGNFVRNTITASAELSKFAKIANISVGEFRELSIISRKLDVDVDTLADGFKDLRINTAEAVAGDKGMREAFAELGISIQEFNKLSPQERFIELGKAIQESADQNDAFLRISKILGEEAGPRLIGVLEELADRGFKKVGDEAERSAEEMAEAAKETNSLLVEGGEFFRARVADTIRGIKIISGATGKFLKKSVQGAFGIDPEIEEDNKRDAKAAIQFEKRKNAKILRERFLARQKRIAEVKKEFEAEMEAEKEAKKEADRLEKEREKARRNRGKSRGGSGGGGSGGGGSGGFGSLGTEMLLGPDIARGRKGVRRILGTKEMREEKRIASIADKLGLTSGGFAGLARGSRKSSMQLDQVVSNTRGTENLLAAIADLVGASKGKGKGGGSSSNSGRRAVSGNSSTPSG